MTESEAIELIENDLKLHSKDLSSKYKNGLRIAIKAIEKQIPKKPVNYDKHYYKCPYCNEDLGIDDDMLFVYDEESFKFCIECGQKLNWSDESEQ